MLGPGSTFSNAYKTYCMRRGPCLDLTLARSIEYNVHISETGTEVRENLDFQTV